MSHSIFVSKGRRSNYPLQSLRGVMVPYSPSRPRRDLPDQRE
jgi:hypothetical protein